MELYRPCHIFLIVFQPIHIFPTLPRWPIPTALPITLYIKEVPPPPQKKPRSILQLKCCWLYKKKQEKSTLAIVPSCFLHGHIDCCTQVILSINFSSGAHKCLAGLHRGTHVPWDCLHVSINCAMLSQRSPHLYAHGSKVSPGAQIAVNWN